MPMQTQHSRERPLLALRFQEMESSEEHQTQSPLPNKRFLYRMCWAARAQVGRALLFPLASSFLAMGSQLLKVGEESPHLTQTYRPSAQDSHSYSSKCDLASQTLTGLWAWPTVKSVGRQQALVTNALFSVTMKVLS